MQKAFEEEADEAGNEADDEHETESDGALGDEQDEELDQAYLDRLAKEVARVKVRRLFSAVPVLSHADIFVSSYRESQDVHALGKFWHKSPLPCCCNCCLADMS